MSNRKPSLATVVLKKGESQQSLLKRFLKKCKKGGVLEEIFKKGGTKKFLKKSEVKRLKRKEAERRRIVERSRNKKRNN